MSLTVYLQLDWVPQANWGVRGKLKDRLSPALAPSSESCLLKNSVKFCSGRTVLKVKTKNTFYTCPTIFAEGWRSVGIRSFFHRTPEDIFAMMYQRSPAPIQWSCPCCASSLLCWDKPHRLPFLFLAFYNFLSRIFLHLSTKFSIAWDTCYTTCTGSHKAQWLEKCKFVSFLPSSHVG